MTHRALLVYRRDVHRDPDRMPFGVDVALLGPVAVALPDEQVGEGLEIGLDMVGMGDLAEGPAEQLVLRVAGELAERAVDALEAAAGRDQRHPDLAVVERAPEELLGLSQASAR